MPKSKINLEPLTRFFESNPDRVFAPADLQLLFFQKASEWNLPQSMRSQAFVQILLNRTKLKEVRLRSRYYASLVRYGWEGKASPMAVAISIKKDGAFFSHASAMWIHGLSEDHTSIFINKEQSEKPKNSGQLSQEAIDRAFQNQQRRSKLAYKYQDVIITVLSGKNTGRAGVVLVTAPSGHKVEVSSLERTLIDITVRPGYSGGVSSVLKAFRLAQNRVSVGELLALLRRLDYTYPYHQSIGFYLKRAGYAEANQVLARTDGVKFDFHLCHGLKNPAFDPDWRVFFPRTLK